MVCLRNGWKGMAKAYRVGLGEWGGVWIKREEPVPGGLVCWVRFGTLGNVLYLHVKRFYRICIYKI